MGAREHLIHSMLGKTVHIVVDRPIGYRHGDIVYPVNYGYIPGVMAGDGEEQDVYILGVEEPLTEFTGQIIGAVRRTDDTEDKLVAAPEGMLLHQGQIADAVRFQEQYFHGTIDSLFRKSCGVIPYRRTHRGIEFLILLQNNRSWSFPKGHMEAGESETQTALRELREETGLRAKLNLDMPVILTYNVSTMVLKQVILYPGEVSGKITRQESEIKAYKWVSFENLKHYLHEDTCDACAALLPLAEQSANKHKKHPLP